MAATTTIKVSAQLRDRINREAGERGLTAAALLEELVADHERRQRLDAFRRAFAHGDAQYREEANAWAAIETDWPHA